jgi:hypothetical protein
MKLIKTTPDFLPLEKFNFTDEQLIEMYDCVFDTTHSDGFKKSEIKDLLFDMDYQFMQARKENWEVNLKDKIAKFEYRIFKSE